MAPAPTRRRVTDLAEVKRLAMRQVAAGGVHSLSLNAIARELGLTGPALYRYVTGRDELVTLLLVDTYDDFAGILEAAASGGGAPERRLAAVGEAYRVWGLAHPERYDLLFGTPLPDFVAPEEATRGPAQRALAVLVAIWAELLDVTPESATARSRAVRTWSRAHGLVDLEIHGHLDDLGLDPALLFEAELRSLLIEHDG
jgi:AcrR family transcriptional regulator